MSESSKKKAFVKLKKCAIAATILFGVVVIFLLCRFFFAKQQTEPAFSFDGEYFDSILLKNYDMPGADAETMAKYFAWNTYSASEYVDFLSKDFSDAMKESLRKHENEQNVENVLFLIDPLTLYHSGDKSEYKKDIDKYIGSIVGDNPNVKFRSIFPCHSMEYYQQMGEDVYDDIIEAYTVYAEVLSDYDNMLFDFQGNQEWVISNPNMFEDINADKMTEEAGLHLFLQTLSNFYVTDASRVDDEAGDLLTRIKDYDPEEYTAPDLSDLNMIVIGDSIFGNYSGKTSIQGVLHDFTGINVYVHATGGMTASSRLVGEIMGGNLDLSAIGSELASNDGSEALFVVEFGFNDYFEQFDPDDKSDPKNEETYAGALRVGIQKIKEHYPDALIIVTAPGYLANEKEYEQKEGPLNYTLQSYREAAKSVAESEEVYFYDFSERVDINSDNYAYYMEVNYDEYCHYNENGRLLVAKELADYIETIRSGL